MTQIDFYVLDSSEADANLRLACRLAEKAVHAGHRVYCHTNDPDQSLALSDKLWSFRDDAFLPSVKVSAENAAESENAPEPIAISHEIPPEDHHEVIINLTDGRPPMFSRFDRVLELVPAAHDARENSREKYRWYSEHGYPLKKHEIKSSVLG